MSNLNLVALLVATTVLGGFAIPCMPLSHASSSGNGTSALASAALVGDCSRYDRTGAEAGIGLNGLPSAKHQQANIQLQLMDPDPLPLGVRRQRRGNWPSTFAYGALQLSMLSAILRLALSGCSTATSTGLGRSYYKE
mmetsp:Transcript_3988/g.9786  ORF Transcript_3988/g.9786 Transcript_3988/m.9786 type:complete len:138 (+) Transcript_3988:112-525(+)